MGGYGSMESKTEDSKLPKKLWKSPVFGFGFGQNPDWILCRILNYTAKTEEKEE
jgi:hypothetical protein